ncbi:hypothetical protein BASA81_006331 [Batrachochytrium salamandrivorans]|nr:hypothetical protein BASA81_006331 [Batrachochytrium salamandrivorans]
MESQVLLPSTSPKWNLAALATVAACWLLSIVLLVSSSSSPSPLLQPQQQQEEGLAEPYPVPSGAPVVAPPSARFTHRPVSPGERRGRSVNLKMDWAAPHKQMGDPNPLDYAGRPLPPCEFDPLTFGHGELGSFPNREYQAQHVIKCLGEFDDVDAEFECIGLGQNRSAASYFEHDNTLCRCGGLLLANSVCFLPASVQFHYSTKFSVKSIASSRYCTAQTNWTAGKFVHGRYTHDSCKLLDINPKSLINSFAGQFVFVDGDSHQQDLFWGLVAEIRNQRFFAVPSFPPNRKLSNDARYEVSATVDYLDLLAPGELDLANSTLRTCYRTKQPDCVVFVFRFDRVRADYLKSLAELAVSGPPDVLLAGFSSKAYTTYDDPQVEIKQGWEASMSSLTRPMALAWTSFPMNSVFIVQDMTKWAGELDYPRLYSHFALVEAPLWDALVKNSAPTEPGFLTLQLIWHADCRVGVDFCDGHCIQAW